MTQRDRDRLVVLKKAHKKLMTQRQAAEELGITERHCGGCSIARKGLRHQNMPRAGGNIHANRCTGTCPNPV